MPISPLVLQRRLAEVGRIRIGQQVPTKSGGKRPAKLDRLRFTSPSRPLIEKVAAAYGGQVAEWTPANGGAAQWEVITEVSRVPVIVPPAPVSQHMELWSGGGCARRCDGETMMSGEPCLCTAKDDLVCKPTTRLSVMLRDIEGLGVWRLESHGWNAAAELPGMVDFLGRVGGYVDAFLCLKPVRQVTGGQTRDFMVPALEVEGVTPGQLADGGASPAAVGRPGAAAVIEAPRPDYLGEAHAAATLEEWRGIWTRCRDAGHLTGPVKAELTQIGKALREAGGSEAAADPPVPVDELWSQIVAAWPGDSIAEIEDAFAARCEGLHPSSASAAQLTEFLDAVRDGWVKPADTAPAPAADPEKVPF